MDTILIKLSGTTFNPSQSGEGFFLEKIIEQIKELRKNNNIGIVVGAGNIFRGNQHGKKLGLNQTTGHTAGMLATMINGLVLKDLLEKQNLEVLMFSAIECPKVAGIIRQDHINKALKENKIIVFVAGTGNPFFSTDTNAVLRALQINASTVYKCTNVDGIYDSDPAKNKSAKLYTEISYKEFIEKELKVMDLTAITLAKENKLRIRVFNVFKENAIITAVKDIKFGSSIN